MTMCIAKTRTSTRSLVYIFMCLSLWQLQTLADTSAINGVESTSSIESATAQQALSSAAAQKLLTARDLVSMKQWLLARSRVPDKRDSTMTSDKRWNSHVPSFNDWQIYDYNKLYGTYYDKTGLDVIGSSLLLGKRAGNRPPGGLGAIHNSIFGKHTESRRPTGLDVIGSSLLLGKRTENRRLTGLDTIGSSLLLGKRTENRRLTGLDTIGSGLLLGKRTENRRLTGLDTIGSSLLLGKKRSGSSRLLGRSGSRRLKQ